jgi:hypothetical protein
MYNLSIRRGLIMKKNKAENEDLYIKGYLDGIEAVSNFLNSELSFEKWYGEKNFEQIENEWLTFLQTLDGYVSKI